MPKTILYLVNPEKYFNGLLKIFGDLDGETVIYVTANRPYKYMMDFIEGKKLSPAKFFFIDCVTKAAGIPFNSGVPNCIFVKSPQNLTEISIAINECVDCIAGEKILLLDSLSTLLFYNDSDVLGKFSHFFINKMNLAGVGTIVLALDSDTDKDIIKRIQALSDEVRRA